MIEYATNFHDQRLYYVCFCCSIYSQPIDNLYKMVGLKRVNPHYRWGNLCDKPDMGEVIWYSLILYRDLLCT